jgi:muramoyltetrapeptide carboxypeptidase
VKRPRRLAPGDRVALVAPASAFKREELDLGVAELATLGFEAVYADSVFARDGFVAGSAALRAAALHDAWADPAVAALIAVRGGYGSVQLLPLLDTALMARAAKLFIGYSDLTALLCLHLAHGVSCVHGPMVEGRLSKGPEGYHRASLLKAVSAPSPAGELRPERLETLHPGDAAGALVGGTLTQIVSLLGTPWSFDVPMGAVLFLEDVAERPYRIHRMLTQLAQSGSLARASALIFGEFPGCDEPGGDPAIRAVLHDFTSGFPGPVLFGFPSGHTTGPAWTLPLGVRARVVAGERPAVVIEEAAVS